MLTPSFSTYMTATRLGRSTCGRCMSCCTSRRMSLAMTFSADPHLGMVASRFSGPAVVFLATTTFDTADDRVAALIP